MNVRVMKKISRPFAMLAVVTTGAVLSGCMSALNPPADAASPLAPRVEALVDAHRHYPQWRDFPKATPAPESTQIAASVQTLNAAGGSLAAETSRIEWTLGDPAQFQREVAARVDAAEASAASIQTTEQIEAEAARLRERAKAPPPVDRPR